MTWHRHSISNARAGKSGAMFPRQYDLMSAGKHAPPVVTADPVLLDNVEAGGEGPFSVGDGTEFDPTEFLQYLPDLEAEVFWLVWVKRKSQADAGVLLGGLAQSTVSNRYRRCLEKMAYLAYLTSIDARGVVGRIGFLSPGEREVLVDLLYFGNQEAVGRRHGMRQSSVRWIALKARRNLEKLERADPPRYFNVLGLVYLLFRNLGLRVRSD